MEKKSGHHHLRLVVYLPWFASNNFQVASRISETISSMLNSGGGGVFHFLGDPRAKKLHKFEPSAEVFFMAEFASREGKFPQSMWGVFF